MKILCIDDDPTFLTMFQKVLEKNLQPEDEIYTELSVEKGVNILNTHTINLVLTDLVMPGQSGLDVLRIAKKINPMTEVIVITGQASIDSAVEAMKFGARDYLTKPLNHTLLIEKIENTRELLTRSNEAEDYRIAKETIEENAVKTIAEMEIRLDKYISVIDHIKQIYKDNFTPEEKLSKISAIIEESDK